MIVLDTNVLSALMQPGTNSPVVKWLDQQPRSSIWTTSVTVFEVRFGLLLLPVGKRQALLQQGFDLLLDSVDHRILPFDTSAAAHAAEMAALRKQKGRPGDLRDTMIAGITVANNATLATRNVRHFEDLLATVVNPWNQE